MKQKKRVINFILAVVCCVCVFLGSGVESRAEEMPLVGTFEYNGYDIYYQYVSGFQMYFSSGVTLDITFDYPCYAVSTYYSNPNEVYVFLVSEVANTYRAKSSNGNSSNQSFTYENGLYRFYVGSSIGNSLITSYRPVYGDTDLIAPFIRYMLSDDFDNLLTPPWEPDFDNYYHEDADRWINDLRAQVEDGVLYATWDGLAGEGLHVLQGYQNTYIQFHLQFVDDKGTASIEDDEYTNLYDFYTELPKNEFSIDLSEFEVPEGYRLNIMFGEPYWYFNDDVNSTMFKGKISYLFFDKDGMTDAPLIKDTGDIYNPLDPNLSTWNAITNFTGDYFYNMGNVMNNTFNNWDSTSMDDSNRYLGDSLANYDGQEKMIINQVSNNLNGFEFDYYLSFSDKVNAGVSFGSMLINRFFEESGDFTILFVVGCVMVFVFIVVGIWRFSK